MRGCQLQHSVNDINVVYSVLISTMARSQMTGCWKKHGE